MNEEEIKMWRKVLPKDSGYNKLIDLIEQLQQQNEFLTKRENKLQTIEQMYKSGSVDLDKLRKIVLEEE